MEVVFVGDVHGKFDQFAALVAGETRPVVQVGDMGVGFAGHPHPASFPDNVRWFRGNHDNPAVSQAHPNYLGDYGWSDLGFYFIGGAWSIDKAYRVPYRNWWPDEELSAADQRKIYDEISRLRPRVLVTHDCPESVIAPLFGHVALPTATGRFLDRIYRDFPPELFLFGHHHVSKDAVIGATRFICLAELEAKAWPLPPTPFPIPMGEGVGGRGRTGYNENSTPTQGATPSCLFWLSAGRATSARTRRCYSRNAAIRPSSSIPLNSVIGRSLIFWASRSYTATMATSPP